jgi:hypothetical protein
MSSKPSGPFFTEDGKPYFVINGRSVWATSGQTNAGSSSSNHGNGSSGSNHARAPSVVSQYESRNSTERPTMPSSYPPLAGPSKMKSRMTSGFPSTRFGGGESQGSAPTRGAESHDPYRKAATPAKHNHGPGFDTPFNQQYNLYKDQDSAALGSEDNYKTYLASSSKVSKKMRERNPGVYGGEPLQTEEWHKTASSYADQSAQLYRQAADSRHRMSEDYIGYDTQEGAKGHKAREELLQGYGRHMDKKSKKHSSSHSGLRK